jgi:TorA maturation chaperone TorD
LIAFRNHQSRHFNRGTTDSTHMATNPVGTAEMTISDAAKVNIARAGVYSFLSRAFKLEVDDSFLETVIDLEPTLRLLSESQGGKELKTGIHLFIDSIEKVRKLAGNVRKSALTDLAAEYATLFLGVGEKPVHLIESVHLGKDHLLYEEPYHEIMDAYKSLGFEKEKNFREPEDHVGVEFDFMAALCRWTSRTLQDKDIKNSIAYLNLQKEFLRDHIMRWVPRMCQQLQDTATSDFYKSLAQLTSGFIELDNNVPDHLTEILKDSAPAK